MSGYRDLGERYGRLTPHQVATLKEAGRGPVLSWLYSSGPLSALRRKGLIVMKSAREVYPKVDDENKQSYGVITEEGRQALDAIAQLDALEASTQQVETAANDEQASQQMSLFERGPS